MRTWVEISRPQLVRNYRALQAASGVAVVGVVKANAYGHGAVEVSRVLAAEGAEWLAVSNVAEGMELRQAGIQTRILVMGGVFPFERDALFSAQLTPVVNSLEELHELDGVGRPLAVHFKIDTGMARLGSLASAQQIVQAIGTLRFLTVEGFLSHFASPGDPLQSNEQIARFRAIQQAIAAPIAHFSSSGAVALDLGLTMVRPGIALYGYGAAGVAPVLTWKARVVLVKELPTGVPVGYGARFVTSRPTRIAVIAAGYADGFPRSLTNKGRVALMGGHAPIAGSVSMDLTTIDVTDLNDVTGLNVQAGDIATLIGEGITADEIAGLAGTISYEVLTGIGARVARVYL